MTGRRALVITFDQLPASILGCYGNDWIETPHLDRLATQSVLFDLHFGENFEPQAKNHAWWTGTPQHPLDESEQARQPALVQLLNNARVATVLLAERTATDPLAHAPPFTKVVPVMGTDGPDMPANEHPFSRLIVEATRCVAELHSSPAPWLVWLESRGVPQSCHPPTELQDLYDDEFEAEVGWDQRSAGPPDDGSPISKPNVDLDNSAEDSDLFRWRSEVAAYVSFIDECLGHLLKFLDDSGLADQSLVIVTAATGDSHGLLTESLVHTPLIVRDPTGDIPGSRCHELVQSTDIFPTLLEWFDLPTAESATGHSLLPWTHSESANRTARECLHLGCGRQQQAIRTREHYLICDSEALASADPASTASHVQLFEKPHDRWDRLDLSREYPAIVEQLLRQAGDAHRRWSGQVFAQSGLSDEAVDAVSSPTVSNSTSSPADQSKSSASTN
ncbi:MAG: sulfatase-like hydrolase/transferase [Planctomycetales bacterium]|nr:sulfatase-like hydrolase/transferase [Planctomycetales bacterium]